jgi:hypothetical protein
MTVSNSPVFEIGSWYQAFHQSHRLVAQNAQRHASDIGVNIYCMNIYIYISYYANIWNAIEGDWRRRRRWWCWWWWWWWMWPTFVCVESQAYVNMSASEYASPPDSLSLSVYSMSKHKYSGALGPLGLSNSSRYGKRQLPGDLLEESPLWPADTSSMALGITLSNTVIQNHIYHYTMLLYNNYSMVGVLKWLVPPLIILYLSIFHRDFPWIFPWKSTIHSYP